MIRLYYIRYKVTGDRILLNVTFIYSVAFSYRATEDMSFLQFNILITYRQHLQFNMLMTYRQHLPCTVGSDSSEAALDGDC